MPVLEPLQALSGSYETIFAKSGRIGDLEITGDITEVTNVTAVGNRRRIRTRLSMARGAEVPIFKIL